MFRFYLKRSANKLEPSPAGNDPVGLEPLLRCVPSGRQWQSIIRQPGGQAGRILGRLPFHARQRELFGLGFDRADDLAVRVEKIVSENRLSGGTHALPRPRPPRCPSPWRSAPPSRPAEADRRFPRGLLVRASWLCLARSGLRSGGLHEDNPRPILDATPVEVHDRIPAGDIPSQPTRIIPKARVRKKPKGG